MKKLAVYGALFVLGGLALWGVMVVSKNESDAGGSHSSRQSTVAVMEEVRREAPPGFYEYRNSQYRFSILVPNDLAAAHIPGDEGSATFIFEDKGGERGFQIFIAQHLEERVSEERFRIDIPSGVRKNVRDIMIDGAVGAAFSSLHNNVGETAEVWFVHEGYLYEVTTLASLETWLSDTMQTWEFIR